ncbi:lysophospholipid acyltransferase family protein [Actinotalea sp. AC32]|nr:lysophospholipid acyltransferase family protein [Actinotalea sp. AC32]
MSVRFRRHHVGPPPGFTWSGAVRRALWRALFRTVGGFTVTGAAPYEAMVVVANHSSHADTPALLAAFPTPYKPMVVAAQDYWFTTRWRRAVVTVLIGAVPVRRVGGGGYESLLDAAQQVLGSGSSLLVFPEGTRSTTGELGTFRSGALRIAKEFQVPLLPVAVVGTHALLPKGGRFRPGPVEVRVGRAIPPDELELGDMGPVVDQVDELLSLGPARRETSPLWCRVHQVVRGAAASRRAALTAAGVGVLVVGSLSALALRVRRRG